MLIVFIHWGLRMRENEKEQRLYFPSRRRLVNTKWTLFKWEFEDEGTNWFWFSIFPPRPLNIINTFPYILQCTSCRQWVIVMRGFYSEICVCSDTFRHLLSSHMLLVLIEHLFYNSQHGSRSFTGAHVYCLDISSALEILSECFTGGFALRLDVQFPFDDL